MPAKQPSDTALQESDNLPRFGLQNSWEYIAILLECNTVAWVVKLVDTRDLKSLARNGVPVRFRSQAPSPHFLPSNKVQ